MGISYGYEASLFLKLIAPLPKFQFYLAKRKEKKIREQLVFYFKVVKIQQNNQFLPGSRCSFVPDP